MIRRARLWLWLACAALIAPQAIGQNLAGDPKWVAEKCARYTDAWQAVTAGEGRAGLGAEFLQSHEAFVGSGCTARAAVCPTSPAEFALADTLTMMAVADGMAGSFLPFACP